jgi:hypothetical protein
MESPKIIITASSFVPSGFIGWSDLAVALLQKYCCKVLISKVSPTKVSIQECLQNQGISFSEENFVTEIDLNDAGISLVALETTTREAIPSMEGKIFASICGPFSQDWKKQIEICLESFLKFYRMNFLRILELTSFSIFAIQPCSFLHVFPKTSKVWVIMTTRP